MPIHTHRVFKHLKRDDVFTEEQADRIAEALSEMDIASATKEDLDATEKRLDGRIDDLDNRLTQRIDEVENRLTQRIELSEERLGQRIERSEKRLPRWMLLGFGAVAALMTVLNYVI